MNNSPIETNISHRLKNWQAPPELRCALHVNATGYIQHADGNLLELFGSDHLRNQNLAARLKLIQGDYTSLPDWLTRCQTDKQALRAQFEKNSGYFTPVEANATYQGNGVYLVNLRSVYNEVVDQFAAQQVCILELLGKGASQGQTLERLVLLIEGVLPETTGSILLLDQKKRCFIHGAAPNLDVRYNKLVDGMKIGPQTGSCGAALYYGRRIIVKDIETDPLWAPYKQEILPLGYKACWSTPFFSEDGITLGTFGIYYKEKREPQPHEIAILDAASYLASVVVKHHFSQQQLRSALAALKKSEERLQTTFDFVNDGLFIHDAESGAIIEANQRAADMYGWTKDELKQLSIADLSANVPPYTQREAKEWIELALSEGPQMFEWRAKHRNGRFFWVEVNLRSAVLEGSSRVLVAARDIDERHHAEEREKENRRVLETLLGNLVGMAYRCRIDEYWTMEFVSFGCLQLTGYQVEELVNNKRVSYEEITHPLDRERVRDEIYEALKQGRQFDVNYRIVTATGNVRHVWERGVGIHSPDGKLELLEGFITDVTEIHKNQAKIAEQAALLDRAQDAIIVRDLEGSVSYWNQGAAHLFGWTAQEAIGKTVQKLYYKDEAAYLSAMQSLLKNGEWSGELHKQTKSKKEIIVESRWTLLRDDLGNPISVLTIDTDQTEKKRLEAQFLRAQRMESIGTLAGGIAHDLNNVLAPIIMSIDLLRLSVNQKTDIELLDQMDASAHRGADLVRQVLSFARGVGGRRININPAYLLKEIAKIVKETFPKSITIRSHQAADLSMVSGDPTQLHQVLLNLCVNARDAMPEGGTMSLLAENIEISASQANQMENATPGHFVRFIVEDTGAGIEKEILGRIFEPFFTTKEVGKGTGLGLSTVLAIVRSHGGFIQVESAPEQGSSFHVYLPACVQVIESPAGQSGNKVPRGNGEYVLVVDDEAPVRSVLKNALETHGYHTLVAENGAEGLALYEREKHRIRVIITDMMMPVMDGPAMVAALHQLKAEQPIIAISGMTESVNIGRATAAGVNHFLAKPFAAETVLNVLHETLHPQNSASATAEDLQI